MSVLNNYVVYKNPSDYPKGKFVVRVHEVGPSGVKVRLAAHAVADTLEAARASIPLGLYRMPRFPEDDPVIVEVWM